MVVTHAPTTLILELRLYLVRTSRWTDTGFVAVALNGGLRGLGKLYCGHRCNNRAGRIVFPATPGVNNKDSCHGR